MKSRRRYLVGPLVLVLVFSLTTSAVAAEKKGSPFKQLILKMMGMTKKTVEKEVSAVGTGIKKGADVVIKEVEDVGRLATGDTSKTKDVLVKPVTGITETIGETAHDVITAPIKAAEEVK